MTLSQRLLFPLLALFILAGCSTRPNTTLNINPEMTLPQQDTSLMGATISLVSDDQRQDPSLAKLNRDGQLLSLTPSRDMRFLMQEVLEKQLRARGYMVGPEGSVNVQVVINNLFADVQEGDLRYNISAKVDISIICQAKSGATQTKNFRSTHNVKGAFSATNKNVENVLNDALTSTIKEMAEDTSISDFIRQNARG
ncbi:YajG family lipoprotein [Leminorella richardii]|nr:YajG family lipoprotein [Leminorella richardii]